MGTTNSGHRGRDRENGSRWKNTGEEMAHPQADPPEARDAENYPTLAQIGVLCLVMIGLVFSTGVVVQVAISWKMQTSSIKPGLIGLIVSEGMMLSSALLLLRVGHMSVRDILRLQPVTKAVLGASLLLAVSWSTLVGEIDSLIQRFIPIPSFMHKVFADLTATQDIWDLALVFVAIVLLPGICEEAFFRGVVLTGLVKQWGTWAGILTSSLLFALLHFNPWQLAPLFLVGVVLGYLVVASRSLYPAILAHSANNLLSWISISRTGQMDYRMPAWLILLSIVFFAIGFAALRKAIRRPKHPG